MLTYWQYTGVAFGTILALGVAMGIAKLLSKKQGRIGNSAYKIHGKLETIFAMYTLVVVFFTGALSMIDLTNSSIVGDATEEVKNTYKVIEVMTQLHDDDPTKVVGYTVKIDNNGETSLLKINANKTEFMCDIEDVDTYELVEKTYEENIVVYKSTFNKQIHRLSNSEQ